MFNLVRRDGARENSGHYEALDPKSGGTAYKVGQLVALEACAATIISGGANNALKPYGVVERIHKNDAGDTVTGVTVLRITDEMEFEVVTTMDTSALKIGAKIVIAATGDTVTTGTVAEGKVGATFVADCGDGKIIVRFE